MRTNDDDTVAIVATHGLSIALDTGRKLINRELTRDQIERLRPLLPQLLESGLELLNYLDPLSLEAANALDLSKTSVREILDAMNALSESQWLEYAKDA